MNSTGRSKKTKTASDLQTYTVTLEKMTPMQCVFTVTAASAGAAVAQAMELDWDDYVYVGADGDGPEYCVDIESEDGANVPVPRKYSFDTVNKETA